MDLFRAFSKKKTNRYKMRFILKRSIFFDANKKSLNEIQPGIFTHLLIEYLDFIFRLDLCATISSGLRWWSVFAIYSLELIRCYWLDFIFSAKKIYFDQKFEEKKYSFLWISLIGFLKFSKIHSIFSLDEGDFGMKISINVDLMK